ncbi:MAG: hypothetical protein JWO86_1517 [Myxococcaceae bacterium]|nr:hypothetical protein [Myxococcaceae bacterium]
MSSKLSHVAMAGVSMVACAAMWIGCGGSSATTTPPVDAGGGTTTEAGSNAEGGTTTDAGTQDSSTAPDASITGPYLDIQFGSCPTLAACGGDPKGLWTVTGGCIDDTIFDAAKMQCPTLTVSNVKFQARGTVLADATTIARKTDVKFTATFLIPSGCKPMGVTMCSQLDPLVKLGGGLDTAACTDAATAGDCTCNVGNTTIDSTSDAYTTSANVLTTGAGSTARTYDYCVAGSEIKYKETTAKTAIPALFTLTK